MEICSLASCVRVAGSLRGWVGVQVDCNLHVRCKEICDLVDCIQVVYSLAGWVEDCRLQGACFREVCNLVSCKLVVAPESLCGSISLVSKYEIYYENKQKTKKQNKKQKKDT